MQDDEFRRQPRLHIVTLIESRTYRGKQQPGAQRKHRVATGGSAVLAAVTRCDRARRSASAIRGMLGGGDGKALSTQGCHRESHGCLHAPIIHVLDKLPRTTGTSGDLCETVQSVSKTVDLHPPFQFSHRTVKSKKRQMGGQSLKLRV